jgi:hypothetical protein
MRADQRERQGRPTRRGDRYEPFPDAVVVVEKRDGTRRRIAIEYVTSKYTDADILGKHASFRGCESVWWFADRASTVERVERITGETCTTLD